MWQEQDPNTPRTPCNPFNPIELISNRYFIGIAEMPGDGLGNGLRARSNEVR